MRGEIVQSKKKRSDFHHDQVRLPARRRDEPVVRLRRRRKISDVALGGLTGD
jgi:hypothetical protein